MDRNINRPNQKYDHVFIVMRYDSFISGDPKQAITALKVFLSESEARAEAERLNQIIRKRLRDDKEISEYYVTFARIKKGLIEHPNNK